MVGDTQIAVPLEKLIDINQEIERQTKKIEKLENELKPILSRLNNDNFTQNAPKEVIEKTINQKKEIEAQIDIIKTTRKKLS